MATTATNAIGGLFNRGPLYKTVSENYNILNDYRSYTYNLTLSVIKPDDLNYPERWKNSDPGFVILKSGGKGTTGITAPAAPTQAQIESAAAASNALENARTDQQIAAAAERVNATKDVQTANFSSDYVAGFNQLSPGRFDMFIDNLEINSQFAFSQTGGTTFPRSFSFTVIEPYSINGFIESLHAGALAAGYTNYAAASFLLTIKFLGYPDTEDLPSPKEIPGTSRSFPITFRTVGMEVTERGTVYKCSAVPTTDLAFGTANTVKKAINIEGKTIKDALTSLATVLSELNKDAAKDRSNSELHDDYEILFPTIDAASGQLKYDTVNDIGKALLALPATKGKNGVFQDPSELNEIPNGFNYIPKGDPENKTETITKMEGKDVFQLQFAEGSKVHEIIASVIRDSEYVNDILKKLPEKIDEYGFIDYFVIRSEIVQGKEILKETQRPKQTFKFIVTPYKVHVTSIGILNPIDVNLQNYKAITLREYNYLYTGKNIDVINFKLNFDTLFFQAIPYEFNNDVLSQITGAKADNSTDVERGTGTSQSNVSSKQTPPVVVKPEPVNAVPKEGGSGGPRSFDPYRNLSRFVHQALINSNDMSRADLEIFGDPFYVTTSGQGNYNPKLSKRGITVDNEADIMGGQVPVRINFRNPVDIGQNGFHEFDTKLLPFSGIYLVREVRSSFNEGFFKQRLSLVRIPGQVENEAEKPTDIKQLLTQSENPLNQTVVDTTNAVNYSAGELSADVAKRLGDSGLKSTINSAASLFATTYLLKGIAGGIKNTITSLGASSGVTVTANDQNTVKSLGQNSSSQLVGNVANKLSTAQNLAPPTSTKLSSLAATAQSGVAVDLLSKSTLDNLPKVAPRAVAPGVPADTEFLTSIVKSGGPSALAKAYGVKNVSDISPDLLSPEVEKEILNNVRQKISNPLASAGVNLNPVDLTVRADKLKTVETQLAGTNPAVNIIPKDSRLPGVGKVTVTVTASAPEEFGSTSADNSPLGKIVLG